MRLIFKIKSSQVYCVFYIKCFLYPFSVCLITELDQSLQGLLSFERLDRASPDLWPEQSELRFVDYILSLLHFMLSVCKSKL